jgi:8-oxo-dGTP pyrophosphatase MutT (NUDIX family)
MAATPDPAEKKIELGSDGNYSVKVVAFLNGKILLLRNEIGWDLPGGHIKDGENSFGALQRETFEETGVNLTDMNDLNIKRGKKSFFSATLMTDDFKDLVRGEDEHYDMKLVSVDDLSQIDLPKDFRDAIEASIKLGLYKI